MKIIREENNNNGKKSDKMHVREWLHQNAKRPVKIKFGPDKAFYLLNRKGDRLRRIPISDIDGPMIVKISQEASKRPVCCRDISASEPSQGGLKEVRPVVSL